MAAPGASVMRQAAWTGPLSIAVLVAAMYAMTVLSFTLLRALPVVGPGGGAH
jgi:cytochrome c oxidase subunit 1